MLLGHRYYDSETGRFISVDPIGDGDNWYVYCDNNPLGWVDPSGLIHIVVHIGPDGRGYVKIFADAGDLMMQTGFFFPALTIAQGGELIGKFPASNIVPHPRNSSDRIGGGGPFPAGTFPITGIEGPHGSMGPRYPVMRGDHAVGNRGTWIHGGAGSNWERPTGGCVRLSQDACNFLVDVLELNDRNGNGAVDRGDGHRVTR
jgi:hypothetical protein